MSASLVGSEMCIRDRAKQATKHARTQARKHASTQACMHANMQARRHAGTCLLYTSDAADDM
eukprot:9896342-Alexandrium_andersonii.AAC.1